MLPLIDLNPSDESCIYSTLLHIIEQAKQLKIITPCVTFDQPLWIKAVEIVIAKGLTIVVRLGGFHSLMSFLGSVGAVMEGSGLEKLMETVYGKNTVSHMFSGKAVSRALRGHFLVDAALRIKILQEIFPNSNENDDSTLSEEEVNELVYLYDGLSDTDLYS